MYLSLDDLEIKNKLVGVRIDLNSPVINGKIVLNERFYRHSKTIKELVSLNNRVILFTHQGRKGKKDYMSSLEQHAKLLSKVLGFEVYYFDGLIEDEAIDFIKNLEPGEVVLMKNLRHYDFETKKDLVFSNPFIRIYSSLLDYYVLDAFSVAHRKHSSVVGFKDKLINIAGRLFEEELINTLKLKNAEERPSIYILGGEKVEDLIDLIIYSFENNTVNKIITTGFLSVLALEAAGFETNDERIGKDHKKIIEILEKYLDHLEIPSDVAINFNGKRRDIKIEKLKNYEGVEILDIGKNTIKEYKRLIKHSKTIYIKGPAGFFEDPRFALGTKELLKAIIENEKAFRFIGGGH
ncbi:MAG TPA: phosphoglycerate kinase, partial [Nautiliaceae bacterium]|nr:phosphoglycerate kinase [Nautiliaceae bacterium]